MNTFGNSLDNMIMQSSKKVEEMNVWITKKEMLKEREAAMQILKEKNLTEQQFAHFRDYFDLQETEGNASIFRRLHDYII